MYVTLSGIIHTWFSDPLFSPIVDFATVFILAVTAIEGFKSMRATSEANELRILPLLVIKFTGDNLQTRSMFIKNIGNGSAYDIKIDTFVTIVTDAHFVWELSMKVKGVNVFEPGEKKLLSCVGLQNGKVSGIKEFLIFHLDPKQEHSRKPTNIFITFKNSKGIKYYSRIETGQNGLTFTIPPKKLDIIGHLIIKFNNLTLWIQLRYFRFIWKFKKSHIVHQTEM